MAKTTSSGRRPTRSTRAAAVKVPGIWQATEEKSAAYDPCGLKPLILGGIAAWQSMEHVSLRSSARQHVRCRARPAMPPYMAMS